MMTYYVITLFMSHLGILLGPGLGQTTHTLKISSQRGNAQSQSHSVPRTAESNSQV